MSIDGERDRAPPLPFAIFPVPEFRAGHHIVVVSSLAMSRPTGTPIPPARWSLLKMSPKLPVGHAEIHLALRAGAQGWVRGGDIIHRPAPAPRRPFEMELDPPPVPPRARECQIV